MERIPLSPNNSISELEQGCAIEIASSDSDQEFELWASRDLNLVWLPRCDNWHNPSLLITLREAVQCAKPPECRDNLVGEVESNHPPVWFWKAEPTFAAWCARAIHRADASKIPLPDAFYGAMASIRAEIELKYPNAWERDVERMARGPPIRLPGWGIIEALTYHAKYGIDGCPRWRGWEKDAAKIEAVEDARVEAAIMERMRAGLESAAVDTAMLMPTAPEKHQNPSRKRVGKKSRSMTTGMW